MMIQEKVSFDIDFLLSVESQGYLPSKVARQIQNELTRDFIGCQMSYVVSCGYNKNYYITAHGYSSNISEGIYETSWTCLGDTLDELIKDIKEKKSIAIKRNDEGNVIPF